MWSVLASTPPQCKHCCLLNLKLYTWHWNWPSQRTGKTSLSAGLWKECHANNTVHIPTNKRSWVHTSVSFTFRDWQCSTITMLNLLFHCNVRGEPVFCVMAAGWFCEKSTWIGEVEDVKPVLLKKNRISTGNHFEEEDFYPDELWNRRISSSLVYLGSDIIWF